MVIPIEIASDNFIAGYYTDSVGTPHGFTRASDGTITTFDAPKSTGTYVSSVNSQHEVTGNFFGPHGVYEGYVLSALGGFTTFDAPKATETDPRSINDQGVIAGNAPYFM